eukprot:CAMPEP_0206405092 /NCGR_PEP_ID=MMETSP0294-20121207/28847_1 /ASSEMBLY_ACC=CAM_ASM_000327 /TAXON_ID=39354 /ORGANISM="Heterosigma akashiwo, Strain CCMP2393" /LENGTH=37 /DNA_ID= /DNA_START= /DNA_END= /DNA_ORIENTATION=
MNLGAQDGAAARAPVGRGGERGEQRVLPGGVAEVPEG